MYRGIRLDPQSGMGRHGELKFIAIEGGLVTDEDRKLAFWLPIYSSAFRSHVTTYYTTIGVLFE
jgi:hypothetical protein